MLTKIRPLAALAGLFVLAAGLTVAPATAGQPSRSCPSFRPGSIDSESERARDVDRLPVTMVTDSATEKNPVVIDFEQGAAAWWYAWYERGAVVDGNQYFNVQVDTRKRSVGLHARLEWPLAVQELDLYMFDRYGQMVAWSEAFNQVPAEATGDTGGPGFEYIAGYPTRRCEGFTLEDNAMWATPQQAQLKLWLGPKGR